MSHHLTDTIVALATPSGIGAIGVIRLSGPDAIRIANSVFHGKDLEQQASHTVHFGTIHNDEGRILDEVLATVFVAPRSYTGENVVEVSCHGSDYIIQELMQLFIQKGARTANPGEYTLRAFLNGQMDLSQAEAVADLIASSSKSSHAIAMQQMRGGFSDEIKKLRQELIDFASLIELELDFSEEDVEFADRSKLEALVQQIQRIIKALLDSFQLGNVLKNGVSTVIAGRPNSGKSTLLNALLNEERAIVSEIAGTTRDTIEEVLNIKGIQFRIIDTAGIRDATDTIEAIGVEKTMQKVQSSALLVYVFDVVDTQPEEVRADLEKLVHENIHVLVVANKMDLNPYTKKEHYFPENSTADYHWVPVSALNKMNIDYLKESLHEAVLSKKINLESTIVANARHYEALQKSYEDLDRVLRGLSAGITSDFVAMDIRAALHHLGEITGEISTDDLLGNIFGRFCIGK
ncbi:MAG: tRNA uridine-5-carboxymethylaminomethyl(34) synthesis GTPase MnmE [Phaeodactylibacter xiamenensis]|uniref:tRNA modification GTPase MnmE n=1 Tax=Phaeodactylibacter xiamenensis TaxID=1524460 RepID=A0A098S8N2_9BACT|nr:tRNA uridine-5-carboxymethylaminomethyl(34) synthesis GTPase MnmE [Phaeodactylibacter xiamenensis]KGE88023.1 tRNA modification GTPase MnmE [Phaeodactylibacter xiamenensis]MCR9054155.1 tRNA uridine-5-carboxymethylaminomethyl(34) synthesis GTPase MnmE [bacterium]